MRVPAWLSKARAERADPTVPPTRDPRADPSAPLTRDPRADPTVPPTRDPRTAPERGLRADMISLAGGLLAALALPPLHVLPVLLVAFPLLLGRIAACERPLAAARRGWWFGFGYHLIGLYWITEAILIEAARFWWFVPIAVPSLSALLALFIAVPAWLAWHARPGVARVATLAGGWVAADLARQFIGTGFPWNPLGSVWAIPGVMGDVLLQPAALMSVHGLTMATVVLASAPALGWRARGACLALLAGWIGFGVVRLAAPLPPDRALTVVLVQGNVAQGQKWDRTLAATVFERYLRLSHEGLAAAGAGPRAVVWPETASPYQLATDANAREAIAEMADGAPVLAGSVRFDEEGRPRNTLFALNGAAPNGALPNGAVPNGVPARSGRGAEARGASPGTIGAMYDKWHLVPFGEYQPTWVPIGIQVVPGGGFARGPGPTTLRIAGLPPVGALICYEAIFPGQVVDESDRPEWMVNATNDAWFGTSTGPRQHLAAARTRAVEEGLPLLRAANTGISVAFDARGHEIARMEMEQRGFLVVTLPAPLPPTPFARGGLLLPAGVTAILLILGLYKRR